MINYLIVLLLPFFLVTQLSAQVAEVVTSFSFELKETENADLDEAPDSEPINIVDCKNYIIEGSKLKHLIFTPDNSLLAYNKHTIYTLKFGADKFNEIDQAFKDLIYSIEANDKYIILNSLYKIWIFDASNLKLNKGHSLEFSDDYIVSKLILNKDDLYIWLSNGSEDSEISLGADLAQHGWFDLPDYFDHSNPIICASSKYKLYSDYNHGHFLSTVGENPIKIAHYHNVSKAQFSKEDELIIGSTGHPPGIWLNGTIYIVKIKDLETTVTELPFKHSFAVDQLSVDSKGLTLLTQTYRGDGVVIHHLNDLTNPIQITECGEGSNSFIAPRGQYFVTHRYSRGWKNIYGFCVFEIKDNSASCILSGKERAHCFSKDSRYLCTNFYKDGKNHVKIWDLTFYSNLASNGSSEYADKLQSDADRDFSDDSSSDSCDEDDEDFSSSSEEEK